MINIFNNNIKVFALETGDFRLDGGAMMGSVPKVLWEKENPADKLNRIDLALRCLLIDDGNTCVLIETGLGNKINSSFIERFHIEQTEKPIEDSLNSIGYKLEDITHVILTHLHFDHSGGATVIDETGHIRPIFPHAKYYINKRNWDAGVEPNPRDRASYIIENFLAIKENDQLILLGDDTIITENISSIVVNGHTPGQQLIKISYFDETLVFCSDLIPLKSHIKLPWIMGYDLNAMLTLEEKTHFLNKAAENEWWLWFYHDPKIIAVKIQKIGKNFDIIDEIKR